MKLLIIIYSVFVTVTLNAQQPMHGEYYLTGVMETASGFKLNPDSTFEFFFTYGALDRFGSGKWKKDGIKIVFNSRTRPTKDFALVSSSSSTGDFTIRITDNNTMLLRYVHAVFKTANGEIQKTTNEQGIATVPRQKVDSVWLLFELCPDRFSTFAIPADKNVYTFKFEPWISEVFFENFVLSIDGNNLAGKHPLLKGETFRYKKN